MKKTTHISERRTPVPEQQQDIQKTINQKKKQFQQPDPLKHMSIQPVSNSLNTQFNNTNTNYQITQPTKNMPSR